MPENKWLYGKLAGLKPAFGWTAMRLCSLAVQRFVTSALCSAKAKGQFVCHGVAPLTTFSWCSKALSPFTYESTG